MDKLPRTLLEAIRYFSDPDVCLDAAAKMRWPSGQVGCPTCGSVEVRFLATRRLWECKSRHERKQFSIKIGTIMEDSPIGLDKWLPAIWMLANDKNGISSYELARALGVTQTTAWFMLHRIREAMHRGSFEKMSGEVEADETFVGGKASNMHEDRRTRVMQPGPGRRQASRAAGKTIVLGLLERHTRKVHARVISDRTSEVLQSQVRGVVAPGTSLYTDAWRAYRTLNTEYVHQFIDHAEKYVEGHVHTNGIENFWALLKRALHGTYVSVEPFHLDRYVDEEAFRYNERDDSDAGRFAKVLGSVHGKRLTYATLTGKATTV